MAPARRRGTSQHGDTPRRRRPRSHRPHRERRDQPSGNRSVSSKATTPRWCGGARQTRSVWSARHRRTTSRSCARKEMSNELCALGRAVQALQADDDATSGVSRPWGPDATAPRNTTTRGGRQNRGHPTLPDRPSATSWRGRALHRGRPGGSITAQGRGPSPWVWAPLPSPLDGSCGRARAPLGSDPRASQGSAAVSVCAHPAGWQGGSRSLFSDPVPGSRVRVVCPHADECPTTIRPRRRRAGPSRATSASARTPFRGA
jgi:hypothetical protein